MTAPVVFVSYSHDSQEHKQWVLDLATRLRSSGVDAILDQWDLGPGGDLPQFMEQSIARSARVIMICSKRYVDKANAGQGGVGYEKMIVTADLLKTIGSNRVIPVVKQDGIPVLPTFLGSKFYVDLSTKDRFESGMDVLLRDILNAPLFVKPPIGSTPYQSVAGTSVPTQADPVHQLLQALLSLYEESSASGAVPVARVKAAMGTSKLFFDYAIDAARKQKLVELSNSRDTLWILERGRAELLQIAAK